MGSESSNPVGPRALPGDTADMGTRKEEQGRSSGKKLDERRATSLGCANAKDAQEKGHAQGWVIAQRKQGRERQGAPASTRHAANGMRGKGAVTCAAKDLACGCRSVASGERPVLRGCFATACARHRNEKEQGRRH
ncbi:hypothetical protein, conserved in T. vivax [Trypanosoma vivax Y486]|uniref:Uncharacterized protein n=1 Tax=Trypanosoma vivax (strain Y486) TaxID=1055687 RepID=F9WSN0_TRYVY|nr:hypothetical protein, conserved in T. vivax [Trypanosoma vivax Y486]|eukprot:CCD20569.1 hypothetical protein, conserved in T. vivax [Trypanosoma vivax Y486]